MPVAPAPMAESLFSPSEDARIFALFRKLNRMMWYVLALIDTGCDTNPITLPDSIRDTINIDTKHLHLTLTHVSTKNGNLED